MTQCRGDARVVKQEWVTGWRSTLIEGKHRVEGDERERFWMCNQEGAQGTATSVFCLQAHLDTSNTVYVCVCGGGWTSPEGEKIE